MPLRYNANTMGTFTLYQERTEYVDGKWDTSKDAKGRTVYNKFPIQIRQGNALAIFLHIYKEKEPKDPELPWRHDLVCFFADERHLKNGIRDYKKDAFYHLFSGKLKNIRLNLYYKECQTLLKHFTRDGLRVQCYYKEPKNKK